MAPRLSVKGSLVQDQVSSDEMGEGTGMTKQLTTETLAERYQGVQTANSCSRDGEEGTGR